MRKAEYKKDLRVKQKEQVPELSGQNPCPRREGVTVSDELKVFRVGKAEYALVLWDGFENPEHVHFASLQIVPKEAAAPT